MKKTITLGALSLFLALGMTARADEPDLTILEGGIYYGGFMPECVSANGKYVCGSTFASFGFVSEWAQQYIKVMMPDDGAEIEDGGCDLPFINNQGVAIGFDDAGTIKINTETGEIERIPMNGIPDCMTQDGRIIVGLNFRKVYSDYQQEHNIDYQAAYWEDGILHFLPVPTEQELGYYILGSRARYISGDGSVIMGCLVDRLYTNPLVLWFRQPDGSYKLDPVCMKYFSDIKYNEGYYREYVNFQGVAMNQNGTKIAMILRKAPEYQKPATNNPKLLGIYDVQTGDIQTFEVDGNHGILPETVFEVYFNGISNEGTIVGSYENLQTGGISAFILPAGETQPRNLADEYPEISQFADFEDEGTNKVSGISADGRYITGMGWTVDRIYDMGYYVGYVLDRGESESVYDAVEKIESAPNGMKAYYSVSGQKLNGPVKGIYIERDTDGSVRKIVGK